MTTLSRGHRRRKAIEARIGSTTLDLSGALPPRP
jgi:hypothetical protein